MPSTYTLNNGIELIATGEQSGTWGDTTNTNLELLDTALDGQVTFTLTTAGSSSSPTALPIADGVSANSEGRNRLVIVNDGGDLGATAYVQLTPNDAEKIIYIRNDLSGSRSLILFQGTYSASRDYEVPAGTTAVIYFTGGGSGAAVAANVFNNAYFDSLRLGSVSVTAILDEDDMSSDSATSLATQQSIKAYVDSQVTAQDLDFAGDSGTGAVDLDSQTFTVAGTANEIETSASGQTLTVGLPDDVTVATSVTTTTIKTSNIDANDGTAAINIADSTGAVDIDTSLNVDGAVTADGLTVDNELISMAHTGNTSTISFTQKSGTQNSVATISANREDTSTSASRLMFNTNDGTSTLQRMRISQHGDITFYDTSGNASFVYDESAGTTINDQQAARDFLVKSDNNANMLYVDGTNDRVGIANGSPTQALDVTGTAKADNVVSTGTLTVGEEVKITRVGSDATGIYWDRSGTQDAALRVQANEHLTLDNNFGNPIKMRIGAVGSEAEAAVFATSAITMNESGSARDFIVKTDNNDNMLHVDGTNDRVGINKVPTTTFEVDGDTIINTGSGETFQVYRSINAFLKVENGSSNTAIATPSLLAFKPSGTTLNKYVMTADNLELNGPTLEFKDDAVLFAGEDTTSATTQVVTYSFSATDFTGAKLIVCVTDSTATERYITELLVTHDGTTAVATEYGQVATDTALATFDVDISGGNVRLLATPASSNSMTFKVMSTQLLA